MTDDNTSDLAELQIDRQLRGRGASVHMQDGRVSKALGWFWGLVGTFIAGSILIAANNLYQLNLTVARGIDADTTRDTRIADHEQRIRQVERSLSTVEGRVMRGLGIDGYQKKEPTRGN